MIVRASRNAGWLGARSGYWAGADFRAIECVDSIGNTLGMVGYDHWTPNSVQMHVAIESHAAIRPLLGPAFAYPFLEAGKSLAIGYVSAANKRVLRFAEWLGFTVEHEIKDGWSDGVPLIVYKMRREDCRFIPQIRRAA